VKIRVEVLRSWQPIEMEEAVRDSVSVHSETFTGRCSEGVALKANNPL